jgi:hypothetical protein
VDLLLKEVSMSRFRTLAHLVLTAAALVLSVSWAASAVPLQSAKPAVPEAKIAISDKVTAPSEPKLVHQVRPAYPPDAKAEKVEGLFRDRRDHKRRRHQGGARSGVGAERRATKEPAEDGDQGGAGR